VRAATAQIAADTSTAYDIPMPTVMRIGPYRFFFYASDGDEPPHIHVERGECEAKFWLTPMALAHSGGFRPRERRRVLRLVEENQKTLLEKWDEFFSD
jgi:hypothetical protein